MLLTLVLPFYRSDLRGALSVFSGWGYPMPQTVDLLVPTMTLLSAATCGVIGVLILTGSKGVHRPWLLWWCGAVALLTAGMVATVWILVNREGLGTDTGLVALTVGCVFQLVCPLSLRRYLRRSRPAADR
ncbi:hypothetical protein [Streptomyces sp. NPDC058989]|uniref:hypothetical protein n=1 Tax=Streptomyces sp. NPDC058989 TaxID=3346686 RepID=UPI00368FC1E1